MTWEPQRSRHQHGFPIDNGPSNSPGLVETRREADALFREQILFGWIEMDLYYRLSADYDFNSRLYRRIGSMQAKELFVSAASELKDGERKIVPFGDTEIGVYRMDGRLYAYENVCLHQGGPACEGLLMPKVEEVLAPDKTFQRLRFNYDSWHIVCPWHGWEYELTTGEYVVNPKCRLRKYAVAERDGGIYVLTQEQVAFGSAPAPAEAKKWNGGKQ